MPPAAHPVMTRGGSRTGKTTGRSGFTLIEVLVSVAILATGLVVILRAYTTALMAIEVSDETLRASLLIEQKMGDLDFALRRDGRSITSAGGAFSADDFTGDVRLKTQAQIAATSSTVVRVDMVVNRAASGRSYEAVSCVNVVKP